MARYVILATALVSLAFSYPDAPLYPNNVVFASAPLVQQSAQASPQFVTRAFNNAAFTLQNAESPNPALFVAAQPNQVNTAIPQTQPATSAPHRAVFQIVSEGTPNQFGPRNFVTFTRTPSLQLAQSPAEPQQFVPRNFAAFTRGPTQQVVQSPAEPVQSVPRNFVAFTRNPPQQYFGSQTVVAPQTNDQPQNVAQQQFGQRTVFVPASTGEAGPLSASAANSVPPQRSGVRTVILYSPQQTSAQSNVQNDQRPVTPQFAPQPAKPRTVFVARPVQAAEPPQLSSSSQKQPLVVSSSQFFSRNFGDSGAVTYFIQPLSSRAGQTAPSNHESPNAET